MNYRLKCGYCTSLPCMYSLILGQPMCIYFVYFVFLNADNHALFVICGYHKSSEPVPLLHKYRHKLTLCVDVPLNTKQSIKKQTVQL